MAKLFGSDRPAHHDHAGDDFFGTYRNEIDAMRFVLSMPLAQHDVNPTKQLVCGEMGEFLRNEYFRDGSVRGSLMRSIGSFVGSDLQAPQLYSGLEQAQGANEAINILIRRGARKVAAEMWRYTIVQYWATIYDKRNSVSATPSIALLQAHPLSGGLGCPRFGEQATLYPGRMRAMPAQRKIPEGMELTLQGKRLLHGFKARLFANGLRLGDERAVVADIIRATQGSDFPAEDKQKMDGDLREAQCSWIGYANEAVSALGEERMPDVPGFVDRYIVEAMERFKRGENLEGGTEDLNGMGMAVRAMALAEFNVVDSGLNSLLDTAANKLGFDAVVRLCNGRANAQLGAMRTYLPRWAIEDLVCHKWNLPTSTGGVVPEDRKEMERN